MILEKCKRLSRDPSFRRYLSDAIFSLSLKRLYAIVYAAAAGRRRQAPSFFPVLYASSAPLEPLRIILPVVPLAPSRDAGERKTELASVSLSGGFNAENWQTLFEDKEDAMALHRFGWVLTGLESGGGLPWGTVRSWLKWRRNRNGSGLPSYVQDSYTVAERICNFCILLMLERPPVQAFLQELLECIETEAVYLAQHIEYYGYLDTNNHILNNARAFIFSGAILDRKEVLEAGLNLFLNELPNHCSDDGVCREASSHYQWVITRWAVEAALILKTLEHPGYAALAQKVTGMLEACERLSLGGAQHCYIPAVGDVSPDYPPGWYLGMPEAARDLLAAPPGAARAPQAGPRQGWCGLFGYQAQSKIQPSGSWVSLKGDWGRLTRAGWDLLVHAETAVEDPRPNHGHQDLFSFELSWKGKGIIVDRGRKNYQAALDSQEAAVLDECHNSFLVDGRRLDFKPRSFMSRDWLARRRSRPRLTAERNGLQLTLEKPRAGFFLDSAKRMWELEPGRAMIGTRIDGHGRRSIRFFLYLNTERLEDLQQEKLFFSHEGLRCALEWRGLSRPEVSTAERYPRYGQSLPCLKLEWFWAGLLPWKGEWHLQMEGSDVRN